MTSTKDLENYILETKPNLPTLRGVRLPNIEINPITKAYLSTKLIE